MLFFRIFKHLLPTGRAWRITTDKRLREFFEGLSGVGADVKIFLDLVWLDLFPATTRDLDAWDKQFGLPDTGITDQQRRDRLDATWKALGGQDPRYIQDTLQANGFDVFIHEWWEPGTEAAVNVKACATARNPLLFLRRETTPVSAVDCGEPLAECGESFAECGGGINPPGYSLVNKVFETIENIIPLCGEEVAECGEVDAACGNYIDFIERQINYIVPVDPNKFPYFLYIGGEVFGTTAQIDPKRKDEFEALCLKICPAQQWLGILVTYS